MGIIELSWALLPAHLVDAVQDACWVMSWFCS